MVLRWGMSDKLGPISFIAPRNEGLPAAFQQQPYSEAAAELIDAEVRRIVGQSLGEAGRLLTGHRDKLEALARSRAIESGIPEREEIREFTGVAAPSPPDQAIGQKP